jgi:hypothetical protein
MPFSSMDAIQVQRNLSEHEKVVVTHNRKLMLGKQGKSRYGDMALNVLM